MGHGCSSHYDNSHRGFVQHAQKLGTILAICLVVWALTGFMGFWPMWVALVLGIKLAGHARRVYGRDNERDDDDSAPAPEDDFVIV